MQKKYIMRLSQEERELCEQVVDKLKGTSQKVRRANILLKADADGSAWTDSRIAEAFRCRVQTVENIRQKCVLEGFQAALELTPRLGQLSSQLADPSGRDAVLAGDLGCRAACCQIGCDATRSSAERLQPGSHIQLRGHVVEYGRSLVLHQGIDPFVTKTVRRQMLDANPAALLRIHRERFLRIQAAASTAAAADLLGGVPRQVGDGDFFHSILFVEPQVSQET